MCRVHNRIFPLFECFTGYVELIIGFSDNHHFGVLEKRCFGVINHDSFLALERERKRVPGNWNWVLR